MLHSFQAGVERRPLWQLAVAAIATVACGAPGEIAPTEVSDPSLAPLGEADLPAPPASLPAPPASIPRGLEGRTEAGAEAPVEAEVPAEAPPLAATGCRAPEGVSAAPQSFSELSALLNALPRPTSLPCLLESLERPLGVWFTSSAFSAQPANGARSPRTFISLGPLVLSVVPGGAAGSLLEVGYRSSPGRSIKAELEFPLTSTVTAELWHERVAFSARRTVCGACHSAEWPVTDPFYRDGFESSVIVPDPRYRVALSEVRAEAASCDARYEPERCALFDALFAGPVREQALALE